MHGAVDDPEPAAADLVFDTVLPIEKKAGQDLREGVEHHRRLALRRDEQQVLADKLRFLMLKVALQPRDLELMRDPRQNFFDLERLGDVVGAARLEGFDLVHRFI